MDNYHFLAIIMLIVAPCTVFADCRITDFSDKFEVVCSGYNPMSPPTDSKTHAKRVKGSRKAKKVNFEDGESKSALIVMNEEESQLMQARNKQDGYRGKRKSKERANKKVGVGIVAS